MSKWIKVHLSQNKKNLIRAEVIRFLIAEDKVFTEDEIERKLNKSLDYHNLQWIPDEDYEDIFNDIKSRYDSELNARVIEEREVMVDD